MFHILLPWIGADFEFEGIVALGRNHFLGFGYVFFSITRCQSPQHRQAVTQTAAQQFAQWHTQALCLYVEQGGLYRAFGKTIAVDGFVDGFQGLRHIVAFVLQQQWGEIMFDVGFDALRAFSGIVQAAYGGGFTPTDQAVFGGDFHQHQGLHLHGGHRQFVRADGRDAYD